MKYLTLDVETTTTNMGHPFDKNNKLISVGIKKDDQATVTYDIEYSVDPYQELLNDIQIAVNEADVLVGFNIKFDLHWLQRYGIDFKTKRIWDCQLAQFIIMNQANPYPSLNGTAEYYDLGSKLDEVKENYWKNGIDTDKIPYDILDEYLKQDVELTYSVFIEQHDMTQGKERLISLHNQDLLVLQDMEYNGLQYEYDKSLILGNELDEQISKLNKKLYDYHAYDSFNPNSGEHLSAFLYGGNIKERFQRAIGHYKTGSRTGEVKYKWEERLKEFPQRFTPLEGSELKK